VTAGAGPTVICTYRVRRGREREFEALLACHWPALREAGLVTAELSQVYRGADETGKTVFVEIFTWRDAAAVEEAHRRAEVTALWRPMGALCEERLGRPAMEFPHVQRVTPRP